MAVKLLFKKLLRKILFITICGGIWPMMTFSKVLKKRKHSLTIPRLIEQRPLGTVGHGVRKAPKMVSLKGNGVRSQHGKMQRFSNLVILCQKVFYTL